MSRKRKKQRRRTERRTRPAAPKSAPPVSRPAAIPTHTDGRWRFEALLSGVVIGLVGLALFFWPTSAVTADLGKVAGRSYSAGSGGKSSSPAPAGRSYSSGSGRPSPAPSTGGRYSAGGNKPSPTPAPTFRPTTPPPKPPAPSPPPTSRPTPPPLPRVTPPPLPPPLPIGKSGATGTARTYGREVSTNPAAGTKPTGSYDTDAGRAQRHEESRADYQKSQQPKPPAPPVRPSPPPPATYPKPAPPTTYQKPPPLPPTPPPLPPPTYTRGDTPKPNYTDASGAKRDIDPKDARINELRKQLDAERWANRRSREEQAYRNYTPPTVVYSDPFHGLFHYWLLQQAAEERAGWVYNHRDEMDRRRYQEMLEKDRQLEARLRELEAKQTPRDPTYRPRGIDPDLVYSDSYAEAAYNPKKVEPAPEARPQTGTKDRETRATVPPRPRSSLLLRLLTVVGVVVLLGFVTWLVFIKRWGGDA